MNPEIDIPRMVEERANSFLERAGENITLEQFEEQLRELLVEIDQYYTGYRSEMLDDCQNRHERRSASKRIDISQSRMTEAARQGFRDLGRLREAASTTEEVDKAFSDLVAGIDA